MERSVPDRDNCSAEMLTLETQNFSLLLPTSSASNTDFPSAEFLQKCISVNPFELKFREANRRTGQYGNMMDQNGLLPANFSMPSTGGITLLKIPSTLAYSPTIFSNINVLSADTESDGINAAEISRIMQQMRDSSSLSSQILRCTDDCSQAPRTADVLNAVLDMHSDRMSALNSMNVTDGFQDLLSNSSAPTVPSPLQSSSSTPSTSTESEFRSSALYGHPCSSTTITDSVASYSCSNACSSNTNSSPRALYTRPISSLPSDHHSLKKLTIPSSIVPKTDTLITASNSNNVKVDDACDSSLYSESSPSLNSSDQWDVEEVKPAVLTNDQSEVDQNQFFPVVDPTFKVSHAKRRDEGMSVTRSPVSKASFNISNRSCRGRNRLTVNTEIHPDERRMTILERNKAAAVRYRKRKKEEHGKIHSQVKFLQQENAALTTQNQVLRRELERLNDLYKARESRCVCRISNGALFTQPSVNTRKSSSS